LHQVGDLFELNVKLRYQSVKIIHTIKATCFSYKEPSSGFYIKTHPYLVFGVNNWDPNCLHQKPDKGLSLYWRPDDGPL